MRMSTGFIVMIICVFLYGLIISFFKDKNKKTPFKEKKLVEDDPFVCTDGTPGADGLLADDFDRVSSE